MLEIRLLGKYEIKLDGQPVAIASRPARLLLAYLVLNADKQHPRERVGGLIWPESDEANARSNLRQALWRLRKAIGEDYLLVDKQTIAFNREAEYWLDTAVLLDGSGADLLRSVAVYGGELLPGYYEDWVQLERERLNAVFERQMQRLLEVLAGEQRWPELLQWAEQWIALGQIPEPAYRALMLAHAAQGDLAAVAAAYERCEAALQLEVGVEPSAETRELRERLLQGIEIPTVGQAAGQHSAENRSPRHNLTHEATTFIGRQQELAQLRSLFSESRLLTIVGPGGTGKTRLAVTAAAELLGQYENGVFFVSLAPIESPDLITQAIAETIGFPMSSHEDPKLQLLRHLRARSYLLILDNFEHLLAGAGLVSEIIQHASDVTIVITSRERLNLREERLFRIEGLHYPHAAQMADAPAFSAVQLFGDGIRRVRPDYEVGEDDLPAIVRICQMLEGMPLGILLAAAWADTLTPQEIEVEIGRSLDFLQVDWPDAPRRHHSVRAAFEPSWQRLTPVQRELFSALAVFRGGFTREAAEAVAGASLRGLAELVNKSLLRRDLENGRYELHELLRQYAQERLEKTLAKDLAVRKAHAAYYADIAQRGWGQLASAQAQATLTALGADLENLRKAWRFWLDQQDASHLSLFINCYWRLYDIHGWFNTGEQLFADAARQLKLTMIDNDDEELEVIYAQVLGHQAFFLTQMGYSEMGLTPARESVEILQRLNRPNELIIPLDTLRYNIAYVEHAQYMRDSDPYSVKFISTPESQWMRGYTSCWRGRDLAWSGQIEEATKSVKESLRIFEQLDDYYASVWPMIELGNIAVSQGLYSEALEQYHTVFELAMEKGYRWGIAKAGRYVGNVAFILGQYAQSRQYIEISLRFADELGLIRDVVSIVYDLGLIEAAAGDAVEAVRLLTMVEQHPLSNQSRTFSIWLGENQQRFRELAHDLLADLGARLGAEVYQAARTDGRKTTLETAVRQLLSSPTA